MRLGTSWARGFIAYFLCTTVSCGGGSSGPPVLKADPAVQTGCVPGPVAAGRVRAKVIECEGELLTGRMAAGRSGDLLIENANIALVIRGPGEGYYLHGTAGGAIIDAAFAGGEDLLQEIQPIVDFNGIAFDEIVITEAGDDGPAEIVVRGVSGPVPLFDAAGFATLTRVILQQTYRLAPDDNALEIHTQTFAAVSGGETSVVLADLVFAGGRARGFVPGNNDVALGTVGPFFVAGGTTSSYAISYHRDQSSVITVLDLGFFRFINGPSLLTGASGISRWLVVGDGSIASATERAWQLYGSELGFIVGQSAADVDIELRRGGVLTTVGRSDAQGAFRIAVPLGSYELIATDPGRAGGVAAVAVVSAAGQEVMADGVPGAGGLIAFTVRDENAAPIPARALIENSESSRTIAIGASGDAAVKLPIGVYDVSISHGLEYGAATNLGVIVVDAQTAAVDVTLTHLLNTDGWIALDPHLHSEMSVDSDTPLEDRVASVAAEGVEVAVSSDHDFIVDYRPVIAELGLSAHVFSMIGDESSSLQIGHINAWPLALDVARAGGGSARWANVGPGGVFDLLRDGDATRVVQVNHPRDPSLGLFALIDLDPMTLQAQVDATALGLPADTDLNDFGFDAIEIANTKTRGVFEPAFADWLAFLSSGVRVTGTGASDSHDTDAFSGSARTYVWVGSGNDDASTIDAATINTALKGQRAVVAQGAFVTAILLDPNGGQPTTPGDLVNFSGQTVAMLRVSVQAPAWAPTARLRVYQEQRVIVDVLLDQNVTATQRFSQDVSINIDGGDHLFVVRVDSGGPALPVFAYIPEPSFTNALYVDGDGDGLFTP